MTTSLRKRTAKSVMLSFDAEILARVDHAAKRIGVTRSRYLEHAAERLLEEFAADRVTLVSPHKGGAR